MKEQKFSPVKLYSGMIFKDEKFLQEALKKMKCKFGEIEERSEKFLFNATDYYFKEMGRPLYRQFFVFSGLIEPELLADIKIFTNRLEEELMEKSNSAGRVVNIDPGIITSGSLIVATAKNFSHRVPLKNGIYAHIEYLFTKNGVRELDWTYTDFRSEEYKKFFFKVRKRYLEELKKNKANEK